MSAELDYALGFLGFLLLATLAVVAVSGVTALVWRVLHRVDGGSE